MRYTYDEERKVHQYHLRQSWLGDYGMCPQRAKLSIGSSSPPSDASALGTAVHAGIEAILLHGNDDGAVTEAALAAEWAIPGFRNHNGATFDGDLTMARNLVTVWANEVLPRLAPPLGIEEGFSLLVARDQSADQTRHWMEIGPSGQWEQRAEHVAGKVRRELFFEGTMDYTTAHGVTDWKTSGDMRKYSQGEVDRKVQATLYTLAWARNEGVDHPSSTVPFTYWVGLKKKRPEWHSVVTYRSGAHWAWLIKQAWQAVEQYDRFVLEDWPLRDDGWWCSAKWCPHFWMCRGAEDTYTPVSIT